MRYLNIGDPVAFGFKPPVHLIEAVERALRDGHNGYGPSAGLMSARSGGCGTQRARLAHLAGSRVHHGWHVGRHRAGAHGAARRRRRCARADADLPALHRNHREARATARYHRARSDARVDSRHRTSRVGHHAHARHRRHRPEQSDRRDLSGGGPSRSHRVCRASRHCDSRRRGTQTSATTVRYRPSARSMWTRRSSRSRACRRRISHQVANRMVVYRPLSAPGRRKRSPSGSWPTRVCAARCPCSTP